MDKTILKIPAHAKINLYLHVTGKLESGYHTLDSLVTFADVYDLITIEPADQFSLIINGSYGELLSKTGYEDNLVVKAARILADATNQTLDLAITLTKNLPLGAGIGGGSADAAAVLRGLLEYWNIDQPNTLPQLMNELGADVPVCFVSKPSRFLGFGEQIEPQTSFPRLNMVLLNPNEPCSTPDVFALHNGIFKDTINVPDAFSSAQDVCRFIRTHDNDLYAPARTLVPVIDDALHALSGQSGCMLARMSGSGATCFGIFENRKAAENTAFVLKINHPAWWVKSCQTLSTD